MIWEDGNNEKNYNMASPLMESQESYKKFYNVKL